MKVLTLINSLGGGGAETQVAALSHYFYKKGIACVIVCLTDDLKLSPRCHPDTTIISLGIKSKKDFFSAFRRLLSIVSEQKPDIIHAHLFQANMVSRALKLFVKSIPIVNTTHCNYDLDNRNYNPYSFYKYTKKLVQHHTAVSAAALDSLLKFKSVQVQHSSLMYNGLDTSLFEENSIELSMPFRWVAIGRLIKLKNYPLIIGAAKKLKEKINGNFVIDIIGEGSEKNAIEKLIKENNLSEHIRLLGFCNDIPERLKTYHGYLISSNTEGLPMALLEAMASSLVVIATNVGQMPEIINQSKGGIVVGAEDENAYAQAMEEILMMSASDYKLKSDANKEFVDQAFELGAIGDQWVDLYTGLIRK